MSQIYGLLLVLAELVPGLLQRVLCGTSGISGSLGLFTDLRKCSIHSAPLSIRDTSINSGSEEGGNRGPEQSNLNSSMATSPLLFTGLTLVGIMLVYDFAWEVVLGEYPKM